jgi:hypothetical protein
LGILPACRLPVCLPACRLPACLPAACLPQAVPVGFLSRSSAGFWEAQCCGRVGFSQALVGQFLLIAPRTTLHQRPPDLTVVYSGKLKANFGFCRQYCLKNTLLSKHILYEWFEEKKFLEVLWHNFFSFLFL